ncbi:hypothetical protein GCM10020254_37610 [Streptomyces goshikiensis]
MGRVGGPGELSLEGAPVVGVRDARREHLAALRGVRVVGLARLLRTRPGLRDARRQDEVLAQRVALEVLREEQGGTRCGWSVKVTPNISNVSRSCHSAPAYTAMADGSEGAECGTVVRSRRRRTRWFSRETTCAQIRKPVPGSSTALSQSK